MFYQVASSLVYSTEEKARPWRFISDVDSKCFQFVALKFQSSYIDNKLAYLLLQLFLSSIQFLNEIPDDCKY